MLGHPKRKHPEQLEISVRYDMRAGVTQGAELCKGIKIMGNLGVLAVGKIIDNLISLVPYYARSSSPKDCLPLGIQVPEFLMATTKKP